MPFRHPDRSHDLRARIEFEVRERLEEAVDFVCLEALVRDRRAHGLPPPAADSPDDRQAYTDNVLTFLRLLRDDLTPTPGPDDRRQGLGAAGDDQARLIDAQVALARTLPDYWQRFEAVSETYLAAAAAAEPPSRRESRGLLARLFGGR